MSGVPKVPISSRVKPSTKVLIDKSKYTSGGDVGLGCSTIY